MNSLVSSNLTEPCRFTAAPVFRIEGVGVSFDASFSEAGLAPEMDGSVPASR